MKKQLPTDAITHELAQSVFFPKRANEPPPERISERPSARTPERVIAPPLEPVSTRTPEPTSARLSERVTPPPLVPPSQRATDRPHGRLARKAALPEKTERYSFEIYPSQKEHIEEYLYQHKRKTKQKISASHFIRTAIDYYFKALK